MYLHIAISLSHIYIYTSIYRYIDKHNVFCLQTRKKAHTLALSASPYPASQGGSLSNSGTLWSSPVFWQKVVALEAPKRSMHHCVSSLATRQWISSQWSCTRSLPSTLPTTTEHCVQSWSRCWVWRVKRRWRLLWCTSFKAQGRQRYTKIACFCPKHLLLMSVNTLCVERFFY